MNPFELRKKGKIRYRAWLVWCWVRMVLAPQATDHLSAFAKSVRYSVAVLVASIPISFYLALPNNQQFAEASFVPNQQYRASQAIKGQRLSSVSDRASETKRVAGIQAGSDELRIKPATSPSQVNEVSQPKTSNPDVSDKVTEEQKDKSLPVDSGKQLAMFNHSMQSPGATQTQVATLPVPRQRVVEKGSMPQEPVPQKPVVQKRETALEHAKKHADPNYVCPMHPEIISKNPDATCPICGMDLVKVESQGDAGVVTLSPAVVNSLGVRTSKVKLKTLYRKIDSVGYVSVDENSIRTINLRTDGWIEKLAVKTVGERVRKGQLLLEVYSPKLVNAQEEYVQALALGNDVLIKASNERLRSLGVSNNQIGKLKTKNNVQQYIKVYAPQDGVISELNIREGMFVKPSTALINLVDLSSVWLMAEVFERQADWVKVGQRAEARLPYLPDKSWEGKVEYVYPSLDPKTRSLKVRLRFDNPDEQLKPNMYANVNIFAKPRRKVMAIPREALIRTGNEQRVIVSMGDGRFMPMKVRVGIETDNYVEVLDGLGEGDLVVTSSQFLIDSESSMRASLARLKGE